ncbi:MAG: DUF3566 domain-containing protein [bacterium]|nr:DUF3566 domain-containing protein [bacterium]
MATVRRVRRVIRKFDPWTVFKVSLLLHVVFAVATLIGLLVLWSLLVRVGIPQALDDFLALISLIEEGTVFFNNGSRFVRVAIFFSVVFGVSMTLLSTLAAVLYNLVSDVVGGVEVVMLEETLRVPATVPAPGYEIRPQDPVLPNQTDMPTMPV